MATQKEPDWEKVNPWHRAAYDWGRQNNGFFAVRTGSQEAAVWATYFVQLGHTPEMFRRMAAASPEAPVTWTAPAQWPEWLDGELL